MLKRIKYILVILFFTITPTLSSTNVYIIASINNEIITNYDVQKEIKYLQILNKDLKTLEESKKKEIAKNSLINEIIKKKRNYKNL